MISTTSCQAQAWEYSGLADTYQTFKYSNYACGIFIRGVSWANARMVPVSVKCEEEEEIQEAPATKPEALAPAIFKTEVSRRASCVIVFPACS